MWLLWNFGWSLLARWLLTDPSESTLPCRTWIAHTPHKGTSAELPKHIMWYEMPSNCLLNIRCRNIIGNPIVSLLTEKHADFVLKYWTSCDDLKCFCLSVAAMEAKRMQSPHTLQGPGINNESKFTFIWYITGYFIHSSLFIIASICTLNVSRERCIRKMEAVIRLRQASMSPHSSQAHNFSSIRP